MAKRKTWPCWSSCCLGGAGLVLALLSGCQTNVAGMTLPSPHYLEHPPQYIPPSPRFPLTNELAQQEGVNNAPAAGAPQALPLPAVVPGGAGGVP
jgi:hypothetical protein